MLFSAIKSTITSTVCALSDDELIEQTGRLARLDHQAHVFVIDHLIEIETRRVYLRRGFSSLFDYVKRGLGYSDAATWRWINAMKLCTRIDRVRERLWDGSLTLDAAAQLQHAFERRERERAREARGGGTGSAVRPNGSTRPPPARSAHRKPAPTLESDPKLALDASAQKALVEQAAGKSTRQVMQMLADVDPALAVPADRVRALGEGRWELKAVIDADCQRGLELLKGLLSHVDPRMTLGQLVGRLVQEGLDRHDPGRPPRRGRARGASVGPDRPAAAQEAISDPAAASAPEQSASADRGATSASKRIDRTGSTGAPATKTDRDSYSPAPSARTRTARPIEVLTSAPKEGARAKRAIPAAVRREVWQRDEGRCRYVDPRGGHRCPSRHLLQIDHVLPYALGGGAEPENLRLLCFAHHRDRHSERTSRRGPPA
ncbi:MAG: HNH endonuclease signature motif containing protein [Spirochaetaceae bacterium]|nr:HNH endonuclease signature motif containing protein [Spirochaetaceae bacterium]